MKESAECNQQPANIPLKAGHSFSGTIKLVLGAVYASFATILQAAGVFTGIGYAFSILTTLPIVMAAMLSIRIGLLTYFLTVLLLWIFQPSELLIFPFTTGLLGLALGIAFQRWQGWLAPVLLGGIALTAGILALLYMFDFPVLGPSVSHSFHLTAALLILLFSVFYSLIWVGVIKRFTYHFQKIIKKRVRHPD